jgi:hypothetical protein
MLWKQALRYQRGGRHGSPGFAQRVAAAGQEFPMRALRSERREIRSAGPELREHRAQAGIRQEL